ncbi:MAG: hypothetical protein VX768_05000 [Planctomycetota bacterium]|nr:hypothetical protein [Planctomycetota bacterium]
MKPDFEQSETPSWAHFERLDESCFASEETPSNQIPDAVYRQIKDLHAALIQKEFLLAEKEGELEERLEEFGRQKAELDARRGELSRENTESRLLRLVLAEKGEQEEAEGRENLATLPAEQPVLGAPRAEETAIDFQEITPEQEFQAGLRQVLKDLPIPVRWKSDRVSSGEGSAEATSPTALRDSGTGSKGEEIQPEHGSGLYPESRRPTEIDRLQQSVHQLREKSEVISTVFVELDLMVRDIHRQQELLESMQISRNHHSTQEFQLVSEKVKRRFQKISRQIQLQ